MKKTITKKDILILSISLFVVTTAWIGFDLYHTYITSTISEELKIQIKSIPGSFDTNTIQQLRERQNILPLFTKLTASPSATITPINQTTEGGINP